MKLLRTCSIGYSLRVAHTEALARWIICVARWWLQALGSMASAILAMALMLMASLAHAHPTQSLIKTVAGSSICQEGMALERALNLPSGVAVDNNGNTYIALPDAHQVCKVASDGTITTVAGDGALGYGGDNGPATAAQLASPYGIAVDSNGNLFIADTGNNRIRKVDADGTITTVAGNGSGGYGGDNGPATAAHLNYPNGIAVDSNGNLFIADSGNDRIRKVDYDGTITTVAGDGSGGYGGDNGPATAAHLNSPYSIAVGNNADLFIADTLNRRIRQVNARLPSEVTPVPTLGHGALVALSVLLGLGAIRYRRRYL